MNTFEPCLCTSINYYLSQLLCLRIRMRSRSAASLVSTAHNRSHARSKAAKVLRQSTTHTPVCNLQSAMSQKCIVHPSFGVIQIPGIISPEPFSTISLRSDPQKPYCVRGSLRHCAVVCPHRRESRCKTSRLSSPYAEPRPAFRSKASRHSLTTNSAIEDVPAIRTDRVRCANNVLILRLSPGLGFRSSLIR